MNGDRHRHSRRNSHGSLASRGRPARTFGGLLAFAAALFLCCGVYLIAEPLIHPLTAHDAGVIVGAFTLALAAILLFYLVKPGASRRRTSAAPQDESAGADAKRNDSPSLALENVGMRRTRSTVARFRT